MQFRAYASIAIFFAGAMAASATSSASAAVSTPVDLTEGVPTCGAFLAAGTTCLLQNSDCSAEDLQNIQNLAKTRCGTLLAATGSSASGSAAASVSGSPTAKAAAVSGSATSSAAAVSATSTGGAMQVGASLMAVGAGAIAFIL
ncbi:unnamed protein product [Aureobasidium pullulans]|nr:unnamed protein product [Aureobasidium pullulans]